jgi:Kef-type K+ transport system membrane component KefB
VLQASGFISNWALGFIAFALGQNFLFGHFQRLGRPILWTSVLGAVGPWALVTIGLVLMGQPFHIALLFGAIAAATAPAATLMVVRETGARGRLTDILLGVVAIDDAWGLIIFAISLALARVTTQHLGGMLLIRAGLLALTEIIGALALGGVLGWVVSKLARYIRTQTELLIYVIGFIFLTSGLSLWLGISVLLANMALGTALVNLGERNLRLFDILRRIDAPLYLIFFILAGAGLRVEVLAQMGLLGFVYLLARVAGKIGGASLGAHISRAGGLVRRYLGLALLPQAGVALGMALIAQQEFPQAGDLILSIVVAATVVYEIFGPICTRYALVKAGEAGSS